MGPMSTQDAPRPGGTFPPSRPTNPPLIETCVQEAFSQRVLRTAPNACLGARSRNLKRARDGVGIGSAGSGPCRPHPGGWHGITTIVQAVLVLRHASA